MIAYTRIVAVAALGAALLASAPLAHADGLPGLRGHDHTGITVPDIKQATDFFVNVLGCKEAMSFGQPPSARRSTMLSIQPLDVLVWAADNHVAIIHSVKPGYYETAVARQFGGDLTGLECTVVEANLSQGLHHSTYRVISVGTDRVFTVKRENGTIHRVYILPLP